jgi:hypothetical protein
MSVRPTVMMKACAAGLAALALAGCGDRPTEADRTEAIAVAVTQANPADSRIIAYANYSYRSGKTTILERHGTLVNDAESCRSHGEFHAYRSRQFNGSEVALACVKTNGELVSRHTCAVTEAGKAGCGPQVRTGGLPTAPRFPALD